VLGVMLAFTTNAIAYNMLMNEDGTDNTISYGGSSYTIENLYTGVGTYSTQYYGYTGSTWTGFYIGTIDDENTTPVALNDTIDYYLGYHYEYDELKVEYGGDTDGALSVDITGGTWLIGDESPIGLGFYSIKGGNQFALYYVPPPFLHNGTWTTEHLLVGNDNIPDISHFTAAVTPVPEPATMLLLGTGLIGLATISRRKVFKK